jgi:hypothetical protein
MGSNCQANVFNNTILDKKKPPRNAGRSSAFFYKCTPLAEVTVVVYNSVSRAIGYARSFIGVSFAMCAKFLHYV